MENERKTYPNRKTKKNPKKNKKIPEKNPHPIYLSIYIVSLSLTFGTCTGEAIDLKLYVSLPAQDPTVWHDCHTPSERSACG